MVGRMGMLVVIVSVGWNAGCAPSANVEQERSALLAVDKEWSDSAKDMEKFLSYYAADATVYGQGMPVANGSAAIRAQFKELFAAPGFSVRWTAAKADVSAAGDVGYTSGSTELTMNDAAGKPAVDKGKYLTIWKKQADGQWKVAEDIFNSDAAPVAASSPHAVVAASGLTWGDAPPSLPAGAKLAVVSGDPAGAGPFTIRAQLPAGYRIAAHWHPTDEHVTVLSGTLAVGMGDKFDQAGLKDLTSGGYAALPAKMNHYATARTATTIQVHGMGPFVVNYVNPADDPSKK